MLKEQTRRMTSKGQVTVPAEVRRKLGVRPGDAIVFRILEDRVEIDRAAMTLDEAFGSVEPLQRPEDFEMLKQTAWEEHSEAVLHEMKDE